MEDKNEAKGIKKDKVNKKDKNEIIKPNEIIFDKKPSNNFAGKRKAPKRKINPSVLQKRTTSSNAIEEFLNLNPKNRIINRKNYQEVEMSDVEKKLMICFNYLMSYDDDLNKILSKNEKEITIITIDKDTSFKLIDLDPLSINFCYNNINKEITLYDTSRKITFFDDSKRVKYERFIYNNENLLNVLKELGFKSFYTVINKNTNEDNKETSSIKTEISLGDPSIILEDKSINEIYKDNIKPILREENYDKRYKEYINKLEDLNKNCKDYYGENSTNTYINLKEYKNASLNFYKFKDSQIKKYCIYMVQRIVLKQHFSFV